MKSNNSFVTYVVITTIVLIILRLCISKESSNESVEPRNYNGKYVKESYKLASIKEVKYVADEHIVQLKDDYKNKKISKGEKEFILGLIRVSLEEEYKFGIPANIKIAQSIIESGWGKDGIAKNYNNYYGIKHKRHYTNEEKPLVSKPVSLRTHEYTKEGNKYYIDDKFISYESRWASIRHHSLFLKNQMEVSSRKGYKNLKVIPTSDYRGWANNLQKAGYATSPQYASKLIKIIEHYKLENIHL
jgi:flagellum-specific peptidoglycan hydrolase FlgJ